MDNELKKKKSEIIEIMLVAIAIALGINLVSSSIIELFNINNILIIIIGSVICIGVIIYYLNIKIKSMNMNKIVDGNIILNNNSKEIVKLYEYYSSYKLSDDLKALFLENNVVKNKYKKSIKNIDKLTNTIDYKCNGYCFDILNSAIEYEIISIFTDAVHLPEKDTKTYNINIVPKKIGDNIFIKTFSKDYKKRRAFDGYKEEMEDSNYELAALTTDEGNIYEKFNMTIPKNCKIETNEKTLTIKSKFYNITIQWGIEEVHFPFPDMEFYNFFLKEDKITYDDIELSYFVQIKVQYNILTMFSKKTNNHYLWIKELVNSIVDKFDYSECLKKNDWNLLQNLNKLKEK